MRQADDSLSCGLCLVRPATCAYTLDRVGIGAGQGLSGTTHSLKFQLSMPSDPGGPGVLSVWGWYWRVVSMVKREKLAT